MEMLYFISCRLFQELTLNFKQFLPISTFFHKRIFLTFFLKCIWSNWNCFKNKFKKNTRIEKYLIATEISRMLRPNMTLLFHIYK